MMKKKRLGTVICFGDTIQLLHVRSGKFLTIYPEQLARDERENIRLGLSCEGNTMSWMQLLPRLKIDRPGDPILHTAELLLKLADRPNEYLHCSDKSPPEGYFHEVNCSLEHTAWKMSVFQGSTDGNDPNHLLGSQLVYIHDPEKNANLTTSEHTNENNNDPVTLEPTSTGDFDTNNLWVLECKRITKGGKVNWKTDQVLFRNLNSGKYLCMDTGAVKDSDLDGVLVTTTSYSAPGTLFSMQDVHNATTFLTNDKAMQLTANGLVLTRGDVVGESSTSFTCIGSKDKNSAVNLQVHRYVEKQHQDKHMMKGTGSMPVVLDAFVGISTRNYLHRILQRTVLPTDNFTVATIWPGSDRNEFTHFQTVVQKVVNFCSGFSIDTEDSTDMTPNLKLKSQRQNIICDQGSLAIVLSIVEKLVPVSEKFDTARKGVGAKGMKFGSEEEKIVFEMGKGVLASCLSMIFAAIKGNARNQMFVADFMQVLLKHVNAQKLAAKCITEMLGTNMELQELKIGVREINTFTSLLRASKMNSMYLQLLAACCKCNERGVVGNQITVAEVFFKDHNDILISIHVDQLKRTPVVFDNNNSGLYIPEKFAVHSPVLGQNLITKGLPTISLSWTTNSIDFSPLGLFGKLSVGIQDLFAANIYSEDFQQSRSTKENMTSVADYFIAEMSLAAEMCLGRNYIAMKRVEEVFPYDVLVTMLKMDVTENLKAAVVKLILYLYVDRDPQVVSSVPCLTRTFGEIKKSPTPRLPYANESNRNCFALLQQMISEHIALMQGRSWEPFSHSMMKMMNKLIMYNFYGTEEKLADVIGPLVLALDRRRTDFVPASDNSLMSFFGGGKKTINRMDSSMSYSESVVISPQRSFASISGAAKVNPESSIQDTAVQDMDQMSYMTGDESQSVPWQKTTLDFLESLGVLVFIITLVIVAISVTIYQTLSGASGLSYDIFDYVVILIFFVEIVLRYYCYVFVHQNFTSFFNEILNVIDIVVVAIDLALLGLPDDLGGGAGRYAKALRTARLIRLVRIVRAARLVARFIKDEEATFQWERPVRYGKTPRHELDTMVEAVNVLAYTQRIIEDRNLSLLLRGFYEWEVGTDQRSPVDIFEEVMEKSKELTLGLHDFDQVFIDNLMYVHTDLVQVTLDVLMSHFSSRQVLLNNIQKVQLLISTHRVQQYKRVDLMLSRLERNIETNELWGHLKSENDHKINKETQEIMKDLVDMCTLHRSVLEFDQSLSPDRDIQDLYRNLGFFDIAFKVLGLLYSCNDEVKPVASKNNRVLIKMCNNILYWFAFDNRINQEMLFEEFNYFLETIDMGFNSHRVIEAIFENNESLMRLSPISLIEKFSDAVCLNGHKPQYLSLAASITHCGEKNILDNQYEIVKQLISPARLGKMVSFFCPVNSPEYEEKVSLMAPFHGNENIHITELPEELAYHLEFLRVLSGCTVGRINITTVEAKVQSVYDYIDILDAMLDPRSLLVVKIRLGLFFYNACVEVEIAIPGLAQSSRCWSMLQTTIGVFKQGIEDLKLIEKHGSLDLADVPRQRMEYLVVCAMIVGAFFQFLYDPMKIKGDDLVSADDRVKLTIPEVNTLILELLDLVAEIESINSSYLSEEHHGYFLDCIDGMKKSVGKSVILPQKSTISPPVAKEMDDSMHTDPGALSDPNDNIDLVTDFRSPAKTSAEKALSKKFEIFQATLKDSEEVQAFSAAQSQEFIGVIETLPFLSEDVQSDLRYEALIIKLVNHVRDSLVVEDNEKHLNNRCSQTTTWIIRAFRTMIENKWGMSIYERDDDGGEEQDEACADVVKALNDFGATELCLDLISIGIDEALQLECVKLCVAMLFKEGGSLDVQITMNEHLQSTNSYTFFKQMQISIQKLIDWHEWNEVITLEEGEDPDLPEEIIIIRFLQLMSEGHYQPNQDIVREQPLNEKSVNLLDYFVNYMTSLSRLRCRTSTQAGIAVANTVLEVIQGPCQLNQEFFVVNTELIETINRLLRASIEPGSDCDEGEEFELKKTCIDILQGVLEGQASQKTVYERVLSVLHLDIVQMLFQADEDNDDENAISLRTEALVLLQMFCDYDESLRKQLSGLDDTKGVEVAYVEIFWRGELQRRFFHVPDIMKDLAKPSKDNVVECIDRSNPENKLQDLVTRSHDLYKEIKHQQVLKEWNISGLFSRSNQNTATWIQFYLALLINLLLLVYYTAESGEPELPSGVNAVVSLLNMVQLIFGSFTLVLFVVVRGPVKYQINMDNGHSPMVSGILTALDALTLYYFVYLVFCLLAINYSDTFLTFLLLDIVVKNSTTRDVLNAVVFPRKQLMATLILGMFLGYIFSFFLFYNFRDEMQDGATKNDCDTLLHCMQTCLSYGLRYGAGINEQLNHTLDTRYVVDVFYFFIIMIIMLNVIFGIIIDTFSDLRSKKNERIQDTTEVCLICSIDKQTFDRADDSSVGFRNHVKNDHNMWAFVSFIVYLWEQDKDDDDGLEQYVRRSVENNDICWFPLNKAMCLEAEGEEDDVSGDLRKDVGDTSEILVSNVKNSRNKISDTLDSIAMSLHSLAVSNNDEESVPGDM